MLKVFIALLALLLVGAAASAGETAIALELEMAMRAKAGPACGCTPLTAGKRGECSCGGACRCWPDAVKEAVRREVKAKVQEVFDRAVRQSQARRPVYAPQQVQFYQGADNCGGGT